MAALAMGHLAAAIGLRPAPFRLALAVILLALGLTVLLMEETLPYARLEVGARGAAASAGPAPSFMHIFALASFRDRTMFALSQAGLIEKFVDARYVQENRGRSSRPQARAGAAGQPRAQ